LEPFNTWEPKSLRDLGQALKLKKGSKVKKNTLPVFQEGKAATPS